MFSKASGSGAESEASFTSHTSSSEKIRTAPKPLSSSFTKFEVLEKQRLEQERERIRERRRMLLEEEKRLFDKMRDVPQQTEDESGQAASDDRNTSSSQESNMVQNLTAKYSCWFSAVFLSLFICVLYHLW